MRSGDISQKKGERLQEFVHHCEVLAKGCQFNVGNTERHIRDQIVLGANDDALPEKAISDNLLLKDLYERGKCVLRIFR